MRAYNKKNVYPQKALKAEEIKKSNPEYDERTSTRKQLTQSEYWRHWKMKQKYGIGIFEYREMYRLQEGKCAICGEEKPDKGKSGLVVDHCHRKESVRELLCSSCNAGLGLFKDNETVLQNAIAYLTKHK